MYMTYVVAYVGQSRMLTGTNTGASGVEVEG